MMKYDYCPDRWSVIKIDLKETEETLYKVFANWVGGYAGTDEWKLNSGITRVTKDKNLLLFEGHSGSVYACNEHSYGMTAYGQSVLDNLIERFSEHADITILDANTDFLTIDYTA
jgi:hypothetical protein